MDNNPNKFHLRFRRDSDEEVCYGVVLGIGADEYDYGCMRTNGHPGDCISLACDAAAADGVCFVCRSKKHLGDACPNG